MNIIDNENHDNTSKCCSRCDEIKEFDKFIKRRNICKECINKRNREFRITREPPAEKCCSKCNKTDSFDKFVKNQNVCNDCNNLRRKTEYKNNDEKRQKIITSVVHYKQNKIRQRKEQHILEIGEGNAVCKYCKLILPCTQFRHNRRKCIECEQEWGRYYIKCEETRKKINGRYQTDPIFRFISTQRRRIAISLQKKQMHTIEYLGCNSEQFFQWMSYNFTEAFTFENYGIDWHIDHVIPISRFNLNNEDEQLLGLNWRNTSPLSVIDNLSKSNKIISSQIEQHLEKLRAYHKMKNIELPPKFIELYATQPNCGKPLLVTTSV